MLLPNVILRLAYFFHQLERIFSHAYHGRRGLLLPISDSEEETEKLAVQSQSSFTQNRSTESKMVEDGLHKRNDLDTTLLLHLFGKEGNLEISFEEFSRFMQNLQTEVLELEFQEFSKGTLFFIEVPERLIIYKILQNLKGLGTITELDFAKILLRYTQLDTAS